MKELTPAQAYAKRIIDLVDSLGEDQEKALSELQTIVIERPATLRNALNAYLYKSTRTQYRKPKPLFSHYEK